jgi:hypothetical protein
MTLKKPLRKKWSLILLILLLCGIGIQFIRPVLPNPPVTGDLTAPPEIKNFLERACYDCHSNRTNLAWFDQVVPAYWLVRGHVQDGRKVLNFSTWDSLSRDQQKGKLFECLNQIAFNVMPLPQYVALHPESKVTAQEIAVLRNYLDTLAPVNTGDPKKARAGEDQYAQWVQEAAAGDAMMLARAAMGASTPSAKSTEADGSKPGAVQPTANGIAYTGEYKNWEVISTTERWDNGTLRVILGNETAIRAIREHHINPWPNGTQFAKVAWDAVKDSTGNVHTGEFKQVEFMIKDPQKYAATDGWGWARWKGMQLQPYGKTAVFTTECTNCHKPVQHNDFVFTFPLNLSVNH